MQFLWTWGDFNMDSRGQDIGGKKGRNLEFKVPIYRIVA